MKDWSEELKKDNNYMDSELFMSMWHDFVADNCDEYGSLEPFEEPSYNEEIGHYSMGVEDENGKVYTAYERDGFIYLA